MALEESIEGLDKIESNNITAYIDPKLKEYIEQLGTVTIDYISNAMGGGYRIMIGDGGDCSSGGCGGSC